MLRPSPAERAAFRPILFAYRGRIMLSVRQALGAVVAAFRSGSKNARSGRTRNRACLGLEALDLRLPPSSLFSADLGLTDPTVVNTDTTAVAIHLGATLSRGTGTADTGPRLTNFAAIEIVGGLYRLEGDVIDPAPAGLTVTFGGDPDSLRDTTTTTDANGHFSKVVDVKTDGSDDGTLSAQAVNAAGVATNIAQTLIHAS